jgi:heme/copper-type cytochrome/quinol oxidase subunit 2
VLAALLALAALGRPAAAEADDAKAISFTVVNVEYAGTKVWVPGTLVVNKGSKVTLRLVNNVPSDPNQHGFAIPAYRIAEIVNRGATRTVEFTADKAGIFPIICQLHPAHVGGELVVLEGAATGGPSASAGTSR